MCTLRQINTYTSIIGRHQLGSKVLEGMNLKENSPEPDSQFFFWSSPVSSMDQILS